MNLRFGYPCCSENHIVSDNVSLKTGFHVAFHSNSTANSTSNSLQLEKMRKNESFQRLIQGKKLGSNGRSNLGFEQLPGCAGAPGLAQWKQNLECWRNIETSKLNMENNESWFQLFQISYNIIQYTYKIIMFDQFFIFCSQWCVVQPGSDFDSESTALRPYRAHKCYAVLHSLVSPATSSNQKTNSTSDAIWIGRKTS